MTLTAMANQITDVSAIAGSGVKALMLGKNPLDSGFEAFATLGNLTELQVRTALITDTKLAKLAQAPILSTLSASNSSAREPMANTITSIAPLLTRPTLTSINVNSNTGLRSIAGISLLPNLTSLSVDTTGVLDLSELDRTTHRLLADHMQTRGTLRIPVGATSITYTHPARDMANTEAPLKQPVPPEFMQLGGTTQWDPATRLLTITWDVAQLAGASTVGYHHWLFDGSTKYMEGLMTLDIQREFAVDFDLAGGSGDFPTQTVVGGGTAAKPGATPTREGYVFDGWVDAAGTAYTFETPVTGTTTVFASWTAEPKVAFVVEFDLAAPITGNTTVYASWAAVTAPAAPPQSAATPSTLPATGSEGQLMMLGAAAGAIALLGASALLLRRQVAPRSAHT